MYRVGVIGCSGIGIAHAAGLEGVEKASLAAACDVSEDILSSFEERWKPTWPAMVCYTSHREMLERERLDIITVATSDHRHADLVVDAAQNGAKGIFCEKPLATNLFDADRMIEACERNNTILSVDHTRRFQPLWRYAHEEIVEKGVIGSIQYVVGTLSGDRAMLFRNGTHTIDAICYFADAAPQWVVADLETGYEDYHMYRGDGGHLPATEPGAYGMIRFSNGVRGFYIGGSKTTPLPKQRMEVVGTDGRILIDGSNTIVLYRGPNAESIQPPEWSTSGISAGVRELVRLVDEGGKPVSPGSAGHTVVEITMGFLESQRQGNVPVHIPQPRG